MIEVALYWWQLPALVSLLSLLWLYLWPTEDSGYLYGYGMDAFLQVAATIGVNLLMWLAVLIWRINAV